MYKIFNKIIEFISKFMKNWKEELTTGGQAIADVKTDVKIQGDIFQGNVLSQLVFVTAMMTLNHILREYPGDDKFMKLPKKLHQFMYLRGSLKKFPDIFRMATFIDSTHMKL